ncbi:unnamed protein product [Callosobruchus maculatus]|uniref:Uncharacterized protein n=1 Tax=Callosobruchus maculatus TaxID=64391 RepID=A0A653D2D6_CALMS|nr:unnamed protein product [Callosobruchus maculatus]
MMEYWFSLPLFPLLWFLEILPGGFRFIMTSCIFFKMIRDVYDEKNNKPQGVLRYKSKNKKKMHDHGDYETQKEYFQPLEDDDY